MVRNAFLAGLGILMTDTRISLQKMHKVSSFFLALLYTLHGNRTETERGEKKAETHADTTEYCLFNLDARDRLYIKYISFDASNLTYVSQLETCKLNYENEEAIEMKMFKLTYKVSVSNLRESQSLLNLNRWAPRSFRLVPLLPSLLSLSSPALPTTSIHQLTALI